ncbi:MAG: NADH-quinone oxidoreductase subunit L [Thermodesulfobacteriota bacterium]
MTPPTAQALIFLIPLLPLLGATINGLGGRRLPLGAVWVVACGSVLAAFLLSAAGFIALLQIEEPGRRCLEQSLYQWVVTAWPGGRFSLAAAFRLDPLSVTLCLVVTGVGFLIHLYSVGYMAGDKGQPRYFSFLNLFTFAMLLLVLADNLLLMFVGWEGVGLCSYLLIGFWYTDLDKARAGMKAFLVNRVGDFGFFVGLMLLYWSVYESAGSETAGLSFTQLAQAVPRLAAVEPMLGLKLTDWAALLLFIGATGKSAQIPLYVWLPDAMAGPTPVSAFIHAATMVTAGVYMVVRLSFLYVAAPVALTIVALTGGFTAVYAAVNALTENDIKRVLAYSTISQLGYMFLAAGVAAFGAGIFHLVTHAFFKALLFLGAGSVIHAVHHNDLRRMGGLKSRLPVTALTLFFAWLAICGIPPLSGFMSKDEILLAAFTNPTVVPGLTPILGLLGLAGAGLTAFYMTRLMVLTLAGRFRGGAEAEKHLRESPKIMTVPLVILAGLTLAGGVLGLPPLTGKPHLLHDFLRPALAAPMDSRHLSAGQEILLMAVSTGTALAGMALAWFFYLKRPETPGRLAGRFSSLARLLDRKFYVDEIYDAALVRPVVNLARVCGWFDLSVIDRPVNSSARLTTVFSFLVGWEDLRIVDGAVNWLAEVVRRWGVAAARLQSGRIQEYLYSVVLGLLGLYVIYLWV